MRGKSLRLPEVIEAPSARLTGRVGSRATGTVRLEVFTPLTWIQQLAGDAARRGAAFSATDVTAEMRQPVVRIIATNTNAGTPPVRHIVLRNEARDISIQPLSKEAFSTHVLAAGSPGAAFEGVRVTFPLNGLRKLRGPRDDQAFLITVIDATGSETNVKITRAHFGQIPM